MQVFSLDMCRLIYWLSLSRDFFGALVAREIYLQETGRLWLLLFL